MGVSSACGGAPSTGGLLLCGSWLGGRWLGGSLGFGSSDCPRLLGSGCATRTSVGVVIGGFTLGTVLGSGGGLVLQSLLGFAVARRPLLQVGLQLEDGFRHSQLSTIESFIQPHLGCALVLGWWQAIMYQLSFAPVSRVVLSAVRCPIKLQLGFWDRGLTMKIVAGSFHKEFTVGI